MQQHLEPKIAMVEHQEEDQHQEIKHENPSVEDSDLGHVALESYVSTLLFIYIKEEYQKHISKWYMNIFGGWVSGVGGSNS